MDTRGFSWAHAGSSRPALSGIDLHIDPGEHVLVCGDSGSGKSTLVAALAGVLGGDDEGTRHGEILLRDATGNSEAPGHNIPVGLVLQDPDSQVICARVGDDVAFGCENLGVERAELWQRVHRAVAMVGLNLSLDHPTARLSGGQKQRLALAGVMAMGAGLILLDEPTANLDPQGSRDIVAAVAAVASETGATLVVVEHNYDYWVDILDRAIVLDQGEIVEDAAPEVVVAKRRITGLCHARRLTGGDDAMWCKDLVTRFGPPRNYRLPQAASTVVSGANGSGKTTWLMTMAGLLPARSGEIGLSDQVRGGLKGSPAQWTSRDLACRIGFVFQNPEHQFVARTVHEELRVSARVRGEKPPEERIAELVERLRLGKLLAASPFALSGGEKRRLSVAAALVTAPSVVLLDEPTFGQDPTTFAELVCMLRELVDDGVTIASISHDPHFIAALGDHRIEMRSA